MTTHQARKIVAQNNGFKTWELVESESTIQEYNELLAESKKLLKETNFKAKADNAPGAPSTSGESS